MRRFILGVALSATVFCLAGVTGASAATPQAVGPGDCGAALPRPAGGLWLCSFVENFNGTSLNRAIWTPQTASGSGVPQAHACNVDNPNNIGVGWGLLRLTVRKVPAPVVCNGTSGYYTSGGVSTYRRFSQQYGRFEVRMRVQPTAGSVPGLQESFWMWPDDRIASSVLWPAAGEIDVAELYSKYNTLSVPFLHYKWNDNLGPRLGLNTAHCPAQRGVFNTYVLIWTPTSLTIQINGKTCLVNNSGDPAFKKPYIIALSSMLGVSNNALTAKTPMPATMYVDWVKVWR